MPDDTAKTAPLIIKTKRRVERFKYLIPKLERIFKLLEIVRLERNVRADYIARRLGISKRQVFRYIAALTEAGVPIVYSRRRGYKLSASFYVPPINLSENEIESIYKGLNDQGTKESRIAWLKISTFFPREFINYLDEKYMMEGK
ncbi:HTH domain-containing protein [bacterium]|nr:HTH domain-containing protein [bacterium]